MTTKNAMLPLPGSSLWSLFLLTVFGICLFPYASMAADVTLAWDKPNDSRVVGYKIYSGLSGDDYKSTPDKTITGENQTTCTISGLTEGQIYGFAATSYDADGNESDFSNEVFYNVPKTATPTDTDGDGLSDSDEKNVYGTDPTLADSDNDGISDGQEVSYWGDQWNGDIDGDGVINLLDKDADGDGVTDGAELTAGTAPDKPNISQDITNIEAEAGNVVSPMTVDQDSDASGGEYVQTYTSNDGSVTYSFNIETAGTYKIVARVYAADSGSDSFFVQIDDQDQITWDLNPTADPVQFNTWRDDEVTSRGNGSYDDPQFDPYTVELSAGTHTITFSGRENYSKLDAFSLVNMDQTTAPDQSDPAQETTPTLEAENGNLAGPMTLYQDSEASGGAYIQTTSSNAGSASFSVNVQTAGTYKIAARVYAANSGSDSFFVQIDDQPQITWDLNPTADPAQFNTWRDDEVTSRGNGSYDDPQFDPYTVELSAGTHTITFSGRENYSKLDTFSLVNLDQTSSPDQSNPVQETTPTLEAESGNLASPMTIAQDSDASGGTYIQTTSSNAGSASYSFNIQTADTYKIAARVYAANSGSDSFFVQIDDQPQITWDLNPTADPAQFNTWREDEVTSRGNGSYDSPEYDPYTVELEQGTHTISIRGRESYSKLDHFSFIKK